MRSGVAFLSLTLIGLSMLGSPAVAAAPAATAASCADDDHQWAEGITFTTDWNAAIKEAKQTGKILFIYNGWQKPGI